MKITRAVVPSLFTVLNVFCGFLAIVHAGNGKIEFSAWLIILAAVFDSLDGVMARITRSSSQFGVELDSLGILLSAMPLVFGAIRLARFNVQLIGFEKEYFKGLPIPVAAITICAYMLTYHAEETGLTGWNGDGLVVLVVCLSLLMVSKVRYDTLPKLTRKGIRAHPGRVTIFTIAALVVILSKGSYLFAVLLVMIAYGIVRSLVEWVRGVLSHVEKDPDEESEISSIDI